jgi:hypothetical protein
MTERERLEDAFVTTCGLQENAFRNYQRAKARNLEPVMRATLNRGKRAHAELVRLASELSTTARRNAR